MNCHNCGQQVDEGDRFCPGCGEPRSSSTGPGSSHSGDESTLPDPEVRQLRLDLDAVIAEVGRLSQRMGILERRSSGSQASSPAVQHSPESPSTASHPRAAPVWTLPPSAETQAAPVAGREAVVALGRERREVPVFAPPAQAAPAGGGGIGVPRPPLPDFGSWNWEWLVGGNWLARIGVVALIFGVAFLISLAIDRGWLGEVERVALGLIGGLAFLAAGEYWRRRYGVWAQTVTGGGSGNPVPLRLWRFRPLRTDFPDSRLRCLLPDHPGGSRSLPAA